MVPPGLKPKPTVIERSIEIDVPVERLYRFHLDTRNAPRVSPPGTEFDSIEGEFPVRDGSEVTVVMRQKPIPLPVTWRILIEAVVPNRAVIDVALESPFASWRHEHRFEPLGPDRTRMTDRVTYLLPFGPMGEIGNRMLVRRMLEKAFHQRQELTKRLMERS